MARLLVYYAHPGHKHSTVNRDMVAAARRLNGVSVVDLYADYPRFDIDIDREQERLLSHDAIVFQFPLFWYSTPSLLKEWIDLVLEHGFAYGAGGDKLTGKRVQLAITAAGPEKAYAADGYQRYPLRTFLTPLERTFGLCHMPFLAPYVLFAALRAPEEGRAKLHVEGYRKMLVAIRDEQYDFDAAGKLDVIRYDSLPLIAEI